MGIILLNNYLEGVMIWTKIRITILRREKPWLLLYTKKEEIIKEKLRKISAKASVLTGNDNMIELDPKNPQHKEWFEDDKCKGN